MPCFSGRLPLSNLTSEKVRYLVLALAEALRIAMPKCSRVEGECFVMSTVKAHLDTQQWSPDKLMNYDGITNYSTLKLNNISLLDLLDNHEVTQILARHRIWIFFFWITFVVGMGGNWLVVYVLMRTKQMRTVTNTYLLNLAIVDILYLVTTIPRTSYWTDYWPFGEFMCK